ncbi:MAG TPA: IS110 family transposase [Chryseolinea sp.]|nr:IS110 family transposase [Chryseolinea sp.]
MKFLVVGVDVSKATLDLCIKPFDLQLQINNNLQGFKSFCKELKKNRGADTAVMVVMEHTGNYSARFEKFLQGKSIDYCKIAALEIKRSLGMVRGKNDKIDASRIAQYGWLRREQLKADVPCDDSLVRLKDLLSLRRKIVRDRSGYVCRLKELKSGKDYRKSDPIIQSQQNIVAMLTSQQKLVEKQIRELIHSDEKLKQTSELLKTIKGIGEIVAAFMICCTNNFKRFSKARQFNCYAGLAPFKNESGTSIKGRARVSHLANKEAKSLLNLAACAAIRHDIELKKYYQRRVSGGMKKMSCLNIIRSKIVSRIFAVAKRQTPFVTLPMAA